MPGPLIATDQLGNAYSIVINTLDNNAMVLTPIAPVSPSTADDSITVTALSLITSALRLIGVIASGEAVPIDEANDSLMVLDQMIDAWNADHLAIYTSSSSDYALIAGQQEYTLGPGGDWNSNRPPRINNVSVILLSNPANPIEIPIPMYTVEQWQTEIAVKATTSSFPLVCYDDGGFPMRTLSVWPIPQQVNNLRVYADQSLSVPSTLQTLMSFPPGYAEAFRYNLAMRLAAEFAETPSPVVAGIALESLARLKTMNAPDLSLCSDLSSGPGGYNYRADMFGIAY
jgi:hypothetical protein